MSRYALLLRGINLGPTRRVAMPKLRGLLAEAGFSGVATHLQSGNVALSADLEEADLVERVEGLLRERLGFEVPVVARSARELAAVVRRNPLAAVAVEPKRYQVSFFDRPLSDTVARRLSEAVVEPEALVIDGREAYAWHPNGIARSKLWNALGGSSLGVTATARNWTTVTTLSRLCDA